MKHIRIALAQMKNKGTIQDNLDKSIEFIRQASENHASLILFPEVQLTEFFPQYKGKMEKSKAFKKWSI